MGKSKKLKHLKAIRNKPLEQQLNEENDVKPIRAKKSNQFVVTDIDKQDEHYIDEKLSRKILDEAKRQQSEMVEEYGFGPNVRKTKSRVAEPNISGEAFDSDSSDDSDDNNEIFGDNNDDHDNSNYYEDIQIEVTKEDEKALEMFMSSDAPKRKTLADYIQEKLREKETEINRQFSDDANSLKLADLDDRVVELYKGVKTVLSRYRSGKLPKAFKIIPALSNWEQVLQITDPDGWTAAAMFQATRIFTSNLKEKMAQRFFNLILLPRLRDDIDEYKRLNFHLYQALRKSLFKSGAFFKGIILPLCQSGNCTLREAVIIGSVMAKNHIPILHACAAMLKISEMDYSGANSVFLHILINKKYALPYRVIDGIVYHFLKFANDKRTLPVLWHQCLLLFVQLYKQDLSSEQKEALLELIRVQTHHQISLEIRKQLLNSKSRDEEVSNNKMENISETIDDE